MNKSDVKFFILDNPAAPRPWKMTGGFHMSTPTTTVSSGYHIEAADALVAHTTHSGDVYWGGHAEGKRIVQEGLE